MSHTDLENELRLKVDGDIHFDDIHKHVYSVDASIYEIEPIGIVLPRNKAALIETVRIASTYNIPVIARGAATGITGGCIGHALIIDTSKYLNQILEINYLEEYAICEPGVVQDSLNNALSDQGYRLGPDTSTGNRATIGGMLANNAAGARSLRYGTMADHVESVELVLAGGEVLRFQSIDDNALKTKQSQNNAEGNIYREIDRLRKEYRHEIETHFPKIPRRVSGYNLDALIQPGPLNICMLIAGSEGTLGIATEIKLRICKKAKNLGLCVVHFSDLIEAMHTVEPMLAYRPLSLEMIDHRILEMGKQAPSMRGKLDWLFGNPKAVFVAEFEGDNQSEVEDKVLRFAEDMKRQNIGNAYSCVCDPIKMAHVWEVRKAGLGLLLSKRSYSRAIAFLEDISVGPKQLAAFMEKFCRYLASKGKEAGIYGHVGSGCMHIRPYIDLREADELHLMEQIMVDVSDLLLEHGGALSGEHGDGLVRSWLNKKMFGDRLYQAFNELKDVFDPHHLMNPGKIVNGPTLLQHLRLSPETKITQIKTFLDFSGQGGFELAADLCNGNGLCRKSEKLMCPSFQATNDEFHSTRARAQALRDVINGRTAVSDFTSQGMYDVLDLCLECKGCKTECPSEVDMAKMKAEFLYHYQKKHGVTLRSRLFANIGRINALSAPFATLFNWISSSRFGKWTLGLIGITPERELPQLAQVKFSEWFAKHSKNPFKNGKPVVLYNDTFTEFNHPEIGQAAVKVLETLGYLVIVPAWNCCGRPALSKGRLEQAKAMAEKVVSELQVYAEAGLPIIGLEPSCLLTIKDDFRSLLGTNSAVESVINACTTYNEFLEGHLQDGHFIGLTFRTLEMSQEIKLHGHCHQKALVGTQATMNVLRAIPGVKVSEIDSGCCGMAGSFGYEKEHYAISIKIGELKLFPAVRASKADAWIVADGVSCRSQIVHGTGRRPYHLAEVLARALT